MLASNREKVSFNKDSPSKGGLNINQSNVIIALSWRDTTNDKYLNFVSGSIHVFIRNK